MKKIKAIFIFCCLMGASCTLDHQQDPNSVQPDEILPNLLLNSLQRNLAAFFNNASGTSAIYMRLQNAGSSAYNTVVSPNGFDGLWSQAYANVLQDANTLIKSAEEGGLARHAGMARVIAAYTILTMVDFFGDVPYSEAFKGLANLNPAVDDDAALYDVAIAMLVQAKTDLTTPLSSAGGYLNPIAPTPSDLYYVNNYSRWVKAANTFLLKAYLNKGSVAEINALIADTSPTGGLILAANENFVFRYGTNTGDPDSRSPLFVGQYPAGGGPYMSNWLMWHMFHGYDAVQNGVPGDPRMRFYFYRQATSNNSDPNNIRCVIQTAPAHYPTVSGGSIIPNAAAGLPPLGEAAGNATMDAADPAWGRTFCYPSDRGYWGRDHVDPQGIPPDGFLRTAWGAYPAGGRFDVDGAAGVSATVGMRGAGIQPIMMRAFTNFMLAEAALTLPGFVGGTPASYYQLGIENSMNDVRDFVVNGGYGNGTAAATESATIAVFYPATISPITARAASTANIAALSGLLTIDGVVLIAGDRVLVKNQTTAAENGIYDVAVGAWTRSTISDSQTELANQRVNVTAGTANAGRTWRQTATTITVGTTALSFVVTSAFNTDRDNYVVSALASFNDATPATQPTIQAHQLNYIAREFWLASFGNGIEAYNLYRRTGGLPSGMQPALSASPGTFPRTFWYPLNFVTLNSTAEQKPDLGVKVFWDTKTNNLDF